MSLLFLRWSPASQRRLGFTLIEALIAVTMTLIIMLALAQGFKRLSDDISKGRARLSLSDQLRGVSEILRNDLAGLTVDCDPTAKTTKSGYFLYYEGPIADHHPVTVPINNLPGGTTEEQLSTSKYGDFDDILMFTARSKGDWFRGRVPLAIVKGVASGGNYTSTLSDWTQTVVVASEYAEIAYFMMPGIVPTSNGTYEQYIANPNLTLPIIDRDSPVNPSPTPAMPAYFTPTGNGIPDRLMANPGVFESDDETRMVNLGTRCFKSAMEASTSAIFAWSPRDVANGSTCSSTPNALAGLPHLSKHSASVTPVRMWSGNIFHAASIFGHAREYTSASRSLAPSS